MRTLDPMTIPEGALDRALAENGLEPAFGPLVIEYANRTDQEWRQCCGLSCDPCVLTVARAVDRLRQLVGG